MDDHEANLDVYNIKPAINTANKMAALRVQRISTKKKTKEDASIQ